MAGIGAQNGLRVGSLGRSPFLATAVQRITAFLIDLLILAIPLGASVSGTELMCLPRKHQVFADLGVIALVYAAYQSGYLYFRHGESPGRGLASIRVVGGGANLDLSLAQCIGRPVARIVVLLACTYVSVRLVENKTGLLVAPLLDIFMVAWSPTRQTFADMLCRTLVIQQPPPQPHRAPAGPMFSYADAEFGPRPKR